LAVNVNVATGNAFSVRTIAEDAAEEQPKESTVAVKLPPCLTTNWAPTKPVFQVIVPVELVERVRLSPAQKLLPLELVITGACGLARTLTVSLAEDGEAHPKPELVITL
jgi:hypothetical protein